MTRFADTHPVARKGHFCDLCNRTIRPGEKYRRSAGMDGSTAWTWRECAHCEALISVVWRETGYDEGYDGETVNCWEPNTLAALRVKVQWRRKWQRRDGSLFPIPEVEWRTDKYGFGRPCAFSAAAS